MTLPDFVLAYKYISSRTKDIKRIDHSAEAVKYNWSKITVWQWNYVQTNDLN